jgi:murein DD-endopeptidase MepM/ murein hydrolase activator NlpD
VIYADWAQTGYGYTLIIDHGDGLETWYSHLKGTLLQSGIVERGDPIGEMGSTGNSSGPHVHFEVRVNGERVDPQGYLPDSPN